MGEINGTEPAAAPSIGEQLGLGRHWAPGPVSWGFASFLTPTNEKVHVLLFETTAGKTAIVLTPEDLRRYAAQALEASTGLVLPS